MDSYNEVFRQRTKRFALEVIRVSDALPQTTAAYVLSKQLIRSATSVAANYRAMCIARSDKEKFAKLCIVVEEADETLLWLELLKESGLFTHPVIDQLLQEAFEFTKAFNTYRSKLRPG